MRRLLPIITFILLLTALLAPLAEYFDRWDTAGLGNDTELGVFALIFILCLLLLVSRLISAFAQSIHLVILPYSQRSPGLTPLRSELFATTAPPLSSPPLRI